MSVLCKNYSEIFRKCKFFVVDGILIKKDLIENCDGNKSIVDCCWYKEDWNR